MYIWIYIYIYIGIYMYIYIYYLSIYLSIYTSAPGTPGMPETAPPAFLGGLRVEG